MPSFFAFMLWADLVFVPLFAFYASSLFRRRSDGSRCAQCPLIELPHFVHIVKRASSGPKGAGVPKRVRAHGGSVEAFVALRRYCTHFRRLCRHRGTAICRLLVERWAWRDTDLRATLVYNSVRAGLTDLLDKHAAGQIHELFEQIALDDRLLAVGFCDFNQDLHYRSGMMPRDFSCRLIPVGKHLTTAYLLSTIIA